MLLSFVIWTACSAVFDIDGNKAAGAAVVAFVFIYFFHYDIACKLFCCNQTCVRILTPTDTPLLFGYTTEILPYSLRAKGLTLEMLSIYGSLVILAFVNPIALDHIGWHYYILFCCLLVVIVAVTYFYFPETKGYSLEEIAEIFDGPRPRPSVDDSAIGVGEKDGKEEEGVARVEHVPKL